jgi:nucleotide-binding universal stress UspA family protein
MDGSEDASAALRIGLRAAQLTGGRLRVVTTWVSPATWGRPTPVIDRTPDLEAVQDAAIEAAAGDAAVPVERVVHEGWPAQTLIHESRGADLLVIGRRGHGGFPGLLLGSVSMHSVAHAPCSVLVVPPGAPQRTPGARRIVVGVDGSHGSQVALRLALRAAELVDARLDVVTVWSYPTERMDPYPVPREDLEEQARERQHDAVAHALGPTVPDRVAMRLVQGHPAGALLEESAGADLLVVGSRGRGEIAGTLFGSVSLACSEHAAVPVLVARERHDEAPD